MIHIARQHDLPTRYVRFFKAIEPTPDLDTDRNQLNISIIERQANQQRKVALRPTVDGRDRIQTLRFPPSMFH